MRTYPKWCAAWPGSSRARSRPPRRRPRLWCNSPRNQQRERSDGLETERSTHLGRASSRQTPTVPAMCCRASYVSQSRYVARTAGLREPAERATHPHPRGICRTFHLKHKSVSQACPGTGEACNAAHGWTRYAHRNVVRVRLLAHQPERIAPRPAGAELRLVVCTEDERVAVSVGDVPLERSRLVEVVPAGYQDQFVQQSTRLKCGRERRRTLCRGWGRRLPCGRSPRGTGSRHSCRIASTSRRARRRRGRQERAKYP